MSASGAGSGDDTGAADATTLVVAVSGAAAGGGLSHPQSPNAATNAVTALRNAVRRKI